MKYLDSNKTADRVQSIRLPPWKARSWEEYSDKLIQMLHKIKSDKLTLDDLAKSLPKRFSKTLRN